MVVVGGDDDGGDCYNKTFLKEIVQKSLWDMAWNFKTTEPPQICLHIYMIDSCHISLLTHFSSHL